MPAHSVAEPKALTFSGTVTSGHGRTLHPLTPWRRLRRSVGGFAAYLFSWWRY